MRKLILLSLAAGCAALGADPATVKQCGGCHGLRIIGTQRLSRTGWERELDKMARWGATIQERDALLAYLVEAYGDDKPAPKPSISADGTGK